MKVEIEGCMYDLIWFIPEKALDRAVKFNVTQDMYNWVEGRAKDGGFRNVSEYMRFLVEKDQEQNKG